MQKAQLKQDKLVLVRSPGFSGFLRHLSITGPQLLLPRSQRYGFNQHWCSSRQARTDYGGKDLLCWAPEQDLGIDKIDLAATKTNRERTPHVVHASGLQHLITLSNAELGGTGTRPVCKSRRSTARVA